MAEIVSYDQNGGAERQTVPCLYPGGHISLSITANATVSRRSGRIIEISPDAARDVQMDMIESGRAHILINTSAQFALTIKDSAGNTLLTLYPGCVAQLVCDDSAWRATEINGMVFIDMPWTATSADGARWVAPRAMRAILMAARVDVAGTDASAVSAVVKKAASGTAMASGTAIHSGSINLKGTANTNQSLAIAPADAAIPAGTALGLDFTGTLTSATGCVTVALIPA
jgi:hypothetical protein